MRGMFDRLRLPTGAAVVLVFVVVPLALAGTGGDSGDPQATTSGVKGKVKKLTAKVNALEARLAALEGQVGGTGGGAGGGAGGGGGQPSGAAGGDLTGSYPNPEIAAGAVGGGEIADDAVGSAAIGPGVVGTSEIATDAVGAAQIASNAVEDPEIASDAVGAAELFDPHVSVSGTATSITDGTGENGNYTTGTATVSCVGGDQAIGGWGSWTDNAANDELFISEVGIATGPEQVTVVGGNDTGLERHLVANALCLDAL
jgi:hypothetical protein